MTQQIINLGPQPNDGQGDNLRTAFDKTNENFDQIFTAGPVGSNVQIQGNNIATLQVNQDLALSPNGTGNVRLNNNTIPGANNTWFLGSITNRWRGIYAGNAYIGNITITENLNVPGDVVIGGNLTVEGDTIQLGNITTDSKTIQLSNTATTAGAADGSGITVGANDDIATFLYDSANNVWTTNIGIFAGGPITGTNLLVSDATIYGNVDALNGNFTGTVAANYFVGDGSQLTNLPYQLGNIEIVGTDIGIVSGASETRISISPDVEGWAFLQLPNNDTANVTNTRLHNSAGNVEIGTGDFSNGGYSYQWLFDNTGALTLPDGANIFNGGFNAIPSNSVSLNAFSPDGNTVSIIARGNNSTAVVRTYADTTATTYDWTFDIGGNLTAPGNITATEFFGNIAASNVVGLATVATSGSYNDLVDTPTIPTATSNLINDSGFIVLGNLSVTTNAASGNGALSYDNVTGVFEFTPADAGASNYGDSNVTTLLSDFGSNTIVTTGNVTAQYFQVNGGIIGSDASPAPSLSGFSSLSAIDISATGNVSAGNIVAGYIYGDLTEANVFVGGTANISGNVTAFDITADGIITAGAINVVSSLVPGATGNISANYYFGNGSELTAVNAVTVDVTDTNGLGTTYYPTFIENRTTEQIVRADVDLSYRTDTNTLSVGNVSASGNISANYVLGNGAFLTGVATSYGNANVANFLANFGSNTIVTTGNITANNFIGNISITGNVTGTQSNVDIIAGSYQWTFNDSGNLVLPGNTFAVNYANGTAVSLGGGSAYGDSNVVTLMSAFGSNTVVTTGNITGGNLISSATIFGNPDLILGNVANVLATKTRIVTDSTFSYIQTGNGTAGSTGNIVFSPYLSTTQQVVIDTASGNLNATGNITGGNIITAGNVTGNTAGFAIGYRDIPQVSLAANTTITTSDAGKHYYSTSASALTLTIANNASQAFQVGATINIINQGAGNVNILRGVGVTMYLAGNSSSSDRTLTSYGVASATKVSSDTWFIAGVGIV